MNQEQFLGCIFVWFLGCMSIIIIGAMAIAIIKVINGVQ